jgi:hypothetical protein
MAAVLVLEPIFEADLQPEQYAYRVRSSNTPIQADGVRVEMRQWNIRRT